MISGDHFIILYFIWINLRIIYECSKIIIPMGLRKIQNNRTIKNLWANSE